MTQQLYTIKCAENMKTTQPKRDLTYKGTNSYSYP